MYLFFDTETTGLPKKWDAPIADLENWPRLVQIAWILFDDDGGQVLSKEYIVRPEGFIIPEESAKVHGITTETAMKKGKPLQKILNEFSLSMSLSEFLVAHNMSFDEKVIEAEFLRKMIQRSLFQPRKLCTKEIATEFCKIPCPYGYKWPSLSELHMKLFGDDFEDAHDALVDVNICAKCFFELKRIGIIS